MIKGCQKRVVVVRDVDSTLFEEAFFIVRPCKKETDATLLTEAGKLLQSGVSPASAVGKRDFATPKSLRSGGKSPLNRRKRDFLMLSLGFSLCLTLSWLINMLTAA